MYCIKCGKKLPDDARFCSECGAPVPGTGHGVTSDSIPVTAAVSASAARADTISASLPNMENGMVSNRFLSEPSESENLIAPAKMECLSGDSGSVYIQIPNRPKRRKADAEKRPQPVIQPAEQRRMTREEPVPLMSSGDAITKEEPVSAVSPGYSGAQEQSVPIVPASKSRPAVRDMNLPKISFADRTGGSSSLRNFYIIDFLVRMVGIKENIPLFIYLLLNVGIIGLLVTGFLQVPVGIGLLIGLVLYLISMTAALSPLGEWLLRRRTECKPVDDPEVAERIEPIFYEVYMAAKERDPNMPDNIRLFMNDDPMPNAFATGRRTVCVTKGLLTMSDDEIRASLGHEFGHLSHKDTDRVLVITIGNTFITAICWLAQIGAIIGEVMCHFMAIFMGEDGIFVSLIATLSRLICVSFINLFMRVWTWLGIMLCMKTSRGNEYQADEFSYHLGYGAGLISMLTFLSKMEGGVKPNGLLATLAASHPSTEDRINRVKQLLQDNPM